MLYAGTSGYSFREWIGTFYPPKTKSTDFLSHYATQLNSVEINYTFRRFPEPDRTAGWNHATPTDFRFSIKMHQKVTHRLRLKDVGAPVADFLKALEPLGPKLGVVLFQCPPFLKCDLARLDAFLDGLPESGRFAMEFRHDSWNTAEVAERLQSRSVALCVADVELGTPSPLELTLTAPFAYVRFRKAPPYSDVETASARRLLKSLEDRVEDIYLYAKHDDTGLAPEHVRKISNR